MRHRNVDAFVRKWKSIALDELAPDDGTVLMSAEISLIDQQLEQLLAHASFKGGIAWAKLRIMVP